jgi:hypothetical protein
MNATSTRLPAFKKVNPASTVKRFRSIHPETGDVYEVFKPSRGEFYCLKINHQEMAANRDKAERVKRAQRYATEA